MDEQRIQVTIHTVDGKTYTTLAYLRPLMYGLGMIGDKQAWAGVDLVGGGSALIATDHIVSVVMTGDIKAVEEIARNVQ